MMINLLANNGYIVLNKTVMKKLGLHEAILIGELSSEYVYWQKQNKLENGYFYSTRENIEEQTMLSAHQQRIAIKNLKNINIIKIIQKGMPQKNWYSINEENLYKILSEKPEISSSKKIEHQDVKKFNDKSLKNFTTCSEKIKPHDVKKLNTNNNNKIDRLYNYIINKENQIPKEFENYEMIKKVENQILKMIKETKTEEYSKNAEEWKAKKEYWNQKYQEYEQAQGEYEVRQELYEKQLQQINIRNLVKDTYKLLVQENMSKIQKCNRITRTFGDLSKREIKEIIRKNKSNGFDWYNEL